MRRQRFHLPNLKKHFSHAAFIVISLLLHLVWNQTKISKVHLIVWRTSFQNHDQFSLFIHLHQSASLWIWGIQLSEPQQSTTLSFSERTTQSSTVCVGILSLQPNNICRRLLFSIKFRAISSLSQGQATGPDGFSIVLHENLGYSLSRAWYHVNNLGFSKKGILGVNITETYNLYGKGERSQGGVRQ